ncbi:MAG: TatD family hydrolase [Burkholderiaceae bacterium]|nr:TatD family hydrolase [Burkholderiaceae bacterium]
MQLIDIGVNFHAKQLAGKAETLLARARQAGVCSILATGTSASASNKALALAKEHKEVYATAGVHPHDASQWSASTAAAMKRLWQEPKVVAVGECGLDYNRMFSPAQAQRTAFEAQLAGALETGKPLFLHCRDAFEDFHAMLREAAQAGVHGVVHCFTGSADEAQAYLALGFDIGVTGWVTDLARGGDLRAAVRQIPLERLHLETDAPYLRPKTAPKGEGFNEPAFLPYVAREVAALRGDMTAEQVAAACAANSRRLFKLPLPE